MGEATGEQAQGFVTLAAPILSGMVLVGLLRYACLSGLKGTRGYVYASLTLFMLAETVSMALREMSWLTGVVLPATFLLLTSSFHRLAQSLDEREAARTAREVAFLLFVPGCVTGVLQFFDPGRGITRLVTAAAALCVLVGVVRFFLLLGWAQQRMAEAATPPSPVPSFPGA